jgi:hypothetical protein
MASDRSAGAVVDLKLFHPHANTVRIGSLYPGVVDVADPNHTFEHAGSAPLGDLNDAKSGRAAGCGMRASTQGIGPSERNKDPIAGGGDIREVRCGVVTRWML